MRLLALMITMLAAPVAADQLPPLSTANSAMAGKEVSVSGELRAKDMGGQIYMLFTQDGWYFVQFALDRAELKRVSDCIKNAHPCMGTFDAETVINGNSISLLVFKITELGAT